MENTPENLLKEGRLDEALQALTAQVRSHPSDAPRRVFLFQLLAVLGQWERAQNQLKVAGELDPANILMADAYRAALAGEMQRAEVLAGWRAPVIVGGPEPWVALLLQALKLDTECRHAEAAALREQAFEQAEPVSGVVDGVPFEWLADIDPRFGPCLEVITQGGYAWAPFSRIRSLSFDEPSDLRDKVWAPARITWISGHQVVGFVPARYPGAELSDDGDVVLGRKTDWIDIAPALQVASGQRMFATESMEYPLLDLRAVTFDAA